jgi:hypothetical protein
MDILRVHERAERVLNEGLCGVHAPRLLGGRACWLEQVKHFTCGERGDRVQAALNNVAVLDLLGCGAVYFRELDDALWKLATRLAQVVDEGRRLPRPVLDTLLGEVWWVSTHVGDGTAERLTLIRVPDHGATPTFEGEPMSRCPSCGCFFRWEVDFKGEGAKPARSCGALRGCS